ncbi:MAG: iron-containing alcohol dehydrogenase [Dehalococcoidales bacterium]|nr:iron-containing alcohol dehydrogenase [Dehalococcoidales bacterium]
MTYWFTEPALKSLVPLAGASAVRGLSTPFTVPRLFMGANALSEAAGLGAGVFDMIAASCQQKRAFIVTDKHAVRYANRVSEVVKKSGFTTETWDKAEPEAPLENVSACAEAMNGFEPDVIVAVGGGSVIDGAKAAWVLYERPDIADLATVSPLFPLGLRKKAILVAIPTTSGTGSDCTAVSVVTDTAAKRKIPIVSPELMPDFSVLVPAFAAGMPPELTAGTGLDALTHAIDCVMSPMTNDFTDAMALRAIKMILRYLPRAYRDGTDHEARLRMHIAASMAGIAFGNGGVALTHAMGHALGKTFGIHHGVAVGVFIPYALQFYSPITDKYLDICEVLKIEDTSSEASLAALVERVRSFLRALGIATDLKGLGIAREDFEKSFDTVVLHSFEDPSMFQSPRPATLEQCETLFRYAYEGKDVDF